MMKFGLSAIRQWRILLVALLSAHMLTACAKGNTVAASIHGVNYSGDEFSYIVEDPSNAKNTGGGETIAPFGAGGTMCCYELPRKWRPGIQVKIHITRWLPKKPDGSQPELKETHMTEVPPYVDGKAGELWVLRNADGTVSVVSSDYQPDHEKWPGKVKGGPVPSLEYQRERWDLHIKLAESDIKAAKELMTELEQTPDQYALESWENFKKYRPKDLIGFNGPADPKFRLRLKAENEEWQKNNETKLKKLRESRP